MDTVNSQNAMVQPLIQVGHDYIGKNAFQVLKFSNSFSVQYYW